MAQAETAQSWPRTIRSSDLVLWLWRLLASAQFAVALLGFLALAGLLAVVLPQIPAPTRDNPAAIDVWLEGQKGNFGPFTEPMYRAGLFTVFRAWWFLAGLGLLAVSVCVYAADRFLVVWRNVTRPRERLSDSFFERAGNRAAFATPPAAGRDVAWVMEAVLRRRRFRVRRFAEGDAVYLFADRFAWAQLGSFVSHIAVVLFLVGALVSRFGGYTNALFIAEGTTSPIFAVSHPGQMQVEVVDASASFDDSGTARDYRTELVIYREGQEVARGVTTVNHPLSYGGYRFHQAGYLGEGAALRVRDTATGNTIYHEALALGDLAPAPAIRVQDAQGRVLLEDVIVPTDFIEDARGTLITVPGSSRQFWVGVAPDRDGELGLIVYERDSPDARFVLRPGESRKAGDLRWTFVEAAGLPSTVTPGIPGDGDRSLVVMSQSPARVPYLTVLGPVDGRALTLYPNQPVRIGASEYLFEGRREFAGIEVRRDPGANFIWAAAGLLLAGLLVTFYVPRLRLWARVRPEETVIAGPAERSGAFRSEVRRLARELGVVTIEEKQGGTADAERPGAADD